MKRLVVIAGVIVLFAVLVCPGFAEIRPGKASVSPFIGGYRFDHAMPVKKDAPALGLRLGYDFTERWGVEGAFDWVPTEVQGWSGSNSDTNVYGMRLDALYNFQPTEKLVPYLAAGVGATMADYPKGFKKDGNDWLFNYGGGLKYFLSEDWALRADVRNLLVFDGGRSDWEYTLGVTYYFGWWAKAAPAAVAVADADSDMVADSNDRCPNTPKGVSVDNNGCPLDSDGDGVPDYLDKCPNTPRGGQVDQGGCPIAAEVGPDADGDGVPDSLDKCPNTPKFLSVDKNGCPYDSDGDGVPDYLDKCPNTPKGENVGPDGCPVKAEQAPQKVTIGLAIEFDTAKADIKPEYQDQVKKVADFMTTYPETAAVIEGHTDNVGKKASNDKLSLRRAESVKADLVNKYGIAASRLTAKGFGSSSPIADNATAEGRQKNRRINAVVETTTTDIRKYKRP